MVGVEPWNLGATELLKPLFKIVEIQFIRALFNQRVIAEHAFY